MNKLKKLFSRRSRRLRGVEVHADSRARNIATTPRAPTTGAVNKLTPAGHTAKGAIPRWRMAVATVAISQHPRTCAEAPNLRAVNHWGSGARPDIPDEYDVVIPRGWLLPSLTLSVWRSGAAGWSRH